MSVKTATMEDLVRKLRNDEFYQRIYRQAHERVWETEEEEEDRIALNKEKKTAWDAETEEMIKNAKL